jgi:beta-1,4-mannosyltransferase
VLPLPSLKITLGRMGRRPRQTPIESAALATAAPERQTDTVTVLESFRAPNQMTNPYLTQLFSSFPDSVDARHFSWRSALTRHFDVFHLHWPEVMIEGRTRPRAALQSLRFLLLLTRIRVQRKALVRTLHNERPHETPGLAGRALLALSDRWTTSWILLSPATKAPTDAPSVVAPHGHYRDWFARFRVVDPVPGRLVHFGHIRRYKGVDQLVDAFVSMPEPDLRLRIAGRVRDADIASMLRRSGERDSRITVIDRFLSEEELALEVSAAELVVLPFVESTNSGSLLLALSLARPVLAPASGLVESIATEVGGGWVHTYKTALDDHSIREALSTVRSSPSRNQPDLTGREWPAIGLIHADAFRRARETARMRHRPQEQAQSS